MRILMPDHSTQSISPEAALRVTREAVGGAIKGYLKRNKMSVSEFNTQVLGIEPKATTAYTWIACRGLPSPRYVALLAKALHKPRAFFEVPHAYPQPNGDGADMTATQSPPPPVAPVIVHARNPRKIARERTNGAIANAIADTLEGPARNSLTYWSNPDGSVTVTMIFSGTRSASGRVFKALRKLGVDVTKKDETTA
jgi:hypothetical protein